MECKTGLGGAEQKASYRVPAKVPEALAVPNEMV